MQSICPSVSRQYKEKNQIDQHSRLGEVLLNLGKSSWMLGWHQALVSVEFPGKVDDWDAPYVEAWSIVGKSLSKGINNNTLTQSVWWHLHLLNAQGQENLFQNNWTSNYHICTLLGQTWDFHSLLYSLCFAYLTRNKSRNPHANK